jgi:lysophospholipase L1-like esterase
MKWPDRARLCAHLAFVGLATVVLLSATMTQAGTPQGSVIEDCPTPSDHAAIRSNMIGLNLLQVESDHVYLVVGDSMVEAALLEPICGMTPVNAGIGGGTAEAIADYVGRWSDHRFRAVVIALGVNNATRQSHGDIGGFHTAYEHIIDKLAATGAPLFVADVMPVEKGKALGDAYFDNGAILKLNTEIGALANQYGATRINLHQAFARSDDNAMRPGLTVDGVHPNAEGYRIWRHTIAEAVSGKLKCEPTASGR